MTGRGDSAGSASTRHFFLSLSLRRRPIAVRRCTSAMQSACDRSASVCVAAISAPPQPPPRGRGQRLRQRPPPAGCRCLPETVTHTEAQHADTTMLTRGQRRARAAAGRDAPLRCDCGGGDERRGWRCDPLPLPLQQPAAALELLSFRPPAPPLSHCDTFNCRCDGPLATAVHRHGPPRCRGPRQPRAAGPPLLCERMAAWDQIHWAI